jgi:signal transduction histidine kinase
MPDIEADRLAMIRFFRNCVDNAIKYGGEHLSEIRIGCEEAPDHHILSVHDNGIGMKSEDATRVFELFQRQENSRGKDGAGLGLAIVKEIATRHGGRAWVKTGEGKGTAFFLSLKKGLGASQTKMENGFTGTPGSDVGSPLSPIQDRFRLHD